MTLKIEQFMCRSDNFGILARDTETGETALIDAPQEEPILEAVERTGWKPTFILTTHHHADHVEANLALKERFGLAIVGPEAEAARIPGIDRKVKEGNTIRIGRQEARVIETPGHTAGHISYHFAEAGVAFTADTLFALGCGRLFECKPPVMLASLKKLSALPLETVIHCGHEYTETNGRFALSVDPTNSALKERMEEIVALRADGAPTLPTTLEAEMATNPFLRWHDPVIRRNLDMEDASDEAVFAELRKRKDLF